jgi:hypothetical protein
MIISEDMNNGVGKREKNKLPAIENVQIADEVVC